MSQTPLPGPPDLPPGRMEPPDLPAAGPGIPTAPGSEGAVAPTSADLSAGADVPPGWPAGPPEQLGQASIPPQPPGQPGFGPGQPGPPIYAPVPPQPWQPPLNSRPPRTGLEKFAAPTGGGKVLHGFIMGIVIMVALASLALVATLIDGSPSGQWLKSPVDLVSWVAPTIYVLVALVLLVVPKTRNLGIGMLIVLVMLSVLGAALSMILAATCVSFLVFGM